MATTQIGFANISGLAADTKPTTGIGAGSTFYETDTKKSFIYDGTAWNESGGSGALFQFNYQWKLAVDASPPTSYMSRDNATTASITKLYVNKVDATGHDMSLFLSEITAGDDLTLHDHNDADIYIAFTASAAATLTGNAFTIPVTFVKQNGADFTDNESVNIHWVSESKSVTAPSGLEKIGDAAPVRIGTMPAGTMMFVITGPILPTPDLTPGTKVILAGGPDTSEEAIIDRISVSSTATAAVFRAPLPSSNSHTTMQSLDSPTAWKLIDNPTTVLKSGNVNLMPTGDPTQENVTEVEGVKYKSYTTVEIAALPDYVLGTFLFDSTLNLLVQCTDATAGANVWEPVGGGEPEKGGIAHSATTDYLIGDIVSVLNETYQCITAHTAKAFNATNWLQIWNSEQIQTSPKVPANVGAAYDQVAVQAVLDYAKEIASGLESAKVFKPTPIITGFLISGASDFVFETDTAEEFTVEQSGVTQTYIGKGGTKVVVSGVNSASEITIKLTGLNTFFKMRSVSGTPGTWLSINLRNIGDITILDKAFSGLKNMATFECDANLSSVENFFQAWYQCIALTTFPMIDTSSVTNFGYAWNSCSSLTSFPRLDASSAIDISGAWGRNKELTSFPLIDFPNATNIGAAWSRCSKLTTFPLIDLSSGTIFTDTWNREEKLTSFLLIDLSSATNLTRTWMLNTLITTFPLIDLSSGTTFLSTWESCVALRSMTPVDFSNGINFYYTWHRCKAFVCIAGTLDFRKATNVQNTFNSCTALTAPPSTGTPVRSGKDAVAGTWTNPNSCP